MDWLADFAQNIQDLPPEMLEEIFNFLPPSDFNSVINTCEWWHDIMAYKKAEKLFPKVLPIAIKRNQPFPLKTMMTIRQVNRNWNREADQQLYVKRGNFEPEKYSFTTDEHMERFAAHSASLPRGGNPFLGNQLSIISFDVGAYEPFFQVIRKHGYHLKDVLIGFFIENLPRRNELTVDLLRHIPNIETLFIGGLVGNWDIEANALPLPPLESLTNFNMIFGLPVLNPEQVNVYQRVASTFLTAYSGQLTTIGAPVYLLRHQGIGNFLPNLVLLSLDIGPGQILTTQDLQVLSQVEWKLRSLTFSGSTIEPSPYLFEALNNLRDSLMLLKLRIRIETEFNPTSLLVFTHLVHIRLCIISSLLHIPEELRIRLSHLAGVSPNLRNLELEIRGTGALMDVELDLGIMRSTFRNLKAFSLNRVRDPE